MTLPDHPNNLEKHRIDLWLLDVHQFSSAHFSAAEILLSGNEQARAKKIIRGKDEFIASRWLLRKVLAHYTEIAPENLLFEYTPKGKPFLTQGNISFSLSHSGHWAVLAVGQQDWLGVDIEVSRSTRDLPGIAQGFFHPDEFKQLTLMPVVEQADYFYRLWTLKEAFFKALGTGISAGLEKAYFHWDNAAINATISPELKCDNLPAAQLNWQFYQTTIAPEVHCALAYQADMPARIDWFNAFELPIN
jgi:4'-phosphopantetheinyl transferase